MHKFKKTNLLLFIFLLISKNSFSSNDGNINNKCFLIDKVDLTGNTLLEHRQKSKVISPYLQQCLTLNDMQEIAKSITNNYIKKGYVTSQAIIPEQDLSNHKLVIKIIEGRIKDISINGVSSRLIDIIFPSFKERILNLRDLEHGLEQLNRLTTTQYTLDIQPSDSVGYSSVTINRKAKKLPLKNRLTIDNSGTETTGKILLTNTTTIDSLFGLGEQWIFSLKTNTDFPYTHYSRAYTASVNIPYGYWFYQYQLSHSSSSYSFQDNQKYIYKNKNKDQQFDISRLVYRDNKQRVTLKGALKHKKAKTQLAQQKLLINSPTLTSLSFSPEYTLSLHNGYLIINPTAEFGISLLGATPDYIADNSPRSHYRKLSLNLSYQYLLTEQFSYLTSFHSQYTPDNLYGSEKIAIDGIKAVRGYKETNFNVNNGFYWRNEINISPITSFLSKWNFIFALDYGVAHSDQYETEKNKIIGSAIGASFYHSTFSSQILINKPMFYPRSLKPDCWSLYWSISLAI